MTAIKRELFRIIDANFNRSREGLRVCEDISRFILNSPRISGELKSVRHGISAIIKASPATSKMLLEARDSAGDVGRASRTPSEMKRLGYCDIYSANMQRAKESVRVLEEFFKLIDKKHASALSRIRFRIYDIEKKTVNRLTSLRNTR